MNILERSSMILLNLCRNKVYKTAKEEYLIITRRCLDEDKSISKNFERVLEDRRCGIDIETYKILKRNIKEIIRYYKGCLENEEIKEKRVLGIELKIDIKCAICLSLHKKEEVLYIEKCGHEFGRGCIKEWLKVRKECPLCRSKVDVICEYREK